jgi:dTDP-4-amino-4,6-dideoxygalactose transaminase
VRFTGAEVAFADVDPESGLATAGTIAAALARLPPAERRTVKAVLPVHVNGQVCDMAPIMALAREEGWAVVEDACHALGGRYAEGGAVGGAADRLACFSFHPVKTITSGEGGVVTTADDALAERLARLRSHGMVRDPARFADAAAAFDSAGDANPWYYEMPELGYNYRLSDIHAALGLQQLKKLRRFVARRAELVARYDRLLAPLAPAVRPVKRHGAGAAWHLYPVLIDFRALGLERGTLMRRLRARGVGTQVHYIPVHRQPYYRARYGLADLPGADAYYARVLSLPLFVGLSDAEVERVAGALGEAIRA